VKLTKVQRAALREMFGGRCAYCGHPLGEKWHADHVEPVVRKLEFVRDGHSTRMRTTGEVWYPERDHIGNMMPACVPCNIRKGGADVESFRRGMERSIEVARSATSAYRHALRFGLITEHAGPVVFYFERFAAEQARRAA
jgi:5-methylcytosine-specific restriction endonuclease McrA